MLLRVLVSHQSDAERRRWRRLLPGRREAQVATASSRRALLGVLARETIDLVLVHRPVLGEPAVSHLAEILEVPERPDVVVLADTEDPEDRAALLAAGALAVVNGALPDDLLRETLATLFQRRRRGSLTRLRADRREEQYGLADFVSASPAMQSFMAVAQRVVGSDASLLILGETGVGKERLARAIHSEGRRGRQSFLAVNCGALPETLLESELFGHEEGAFTGATRSRRGLFELAHRGTLFLDEIGEMPLHLQVKLLRVLDERKIRRLGGEREVEVDARVMAATNRDLESDVKVGRFRSDLFYRLAVVTLTVPPLRERCEDIVTLTESYCEYFCYQINRPLVGVTGNAMEALRSYSWPGNVRELINVLERAVLLVQGEKITPADLPEAVRRSVAGGIGAGSEERGGAMTATSFAYDRSFRDARKAVLQEFERNYLEGLLEETEGRVGRAARRAGISERFLYDLMKRHGLDKLDYR